MVQEFTAPATPQQNGISERAGRTLMNVVRCLMDGANLPAFLWGEICCTAVHITNRLPHANLGNETPYYRMYGEQASLKHLRVIGSTAYVHIEPHKTKLDPRAWEGKLVGYSPDSKAYRIYNPRTRKVTTSRNVTFIKTMDAAMPPAGTGEDDENDKYYQEENASSSSSDVSTSKSLGGIEDDFPRENANNPDDSSSSEEEEDNQRSTRARGLQLVDTTNTNKKQLAELKRLSPWNQLATFVTFVSEEQTRIKSPSPDKSVRPSASIPTPTTYQEAMRSIDSVQWKAGMD